MVKDVVVNLTGGHPQDFAADFAISLAASFAAHIAGVAFIYEPIIPGDICRSRVAYRISTAACM